MFDGQMIDSKKIKVTIFSSMITQIIKSITNCELISGLHLFLNWAYHLTIKFHNDQFIISSIIY